MCFGFGMYSLFTLTASVCLSSASPHRNNRESARPWRRAQAAWKTAGRTWPVARLRAALLLGLLEVSPLHAQTAVFTGTQLGGGFDYAQGVAVDSSGNIYVADNQNSTVYEMPPGCVSSSCVTTLGGGFDIPTGVAVDASGNVYVADEGKNAVYEMPPGCASSSCVTPLGGSIYLARFVAVDKNGNVYVNDVKNDAVDEIPPGCASSSCVTLLGTGGFPEPFGVAVDKSGNVYVADIGGDTDNGAVYEMPPGCASSACVTTLGGGFDEPFAVAVDGNGNIYVADTENKALKEMLPGCASSSCVTTLGGGFSVPTDVALDENGNLYIADTGRNVIEEILRNFGAVALGSYASPIPVTFSFTSGGSGITVSVVTQDAQGLDFTDAGTGTCDTNGAANLYSTGDTCTVSVTFAPKYAGARYGAVNLLNGSGAVIATALIDGTGLGPQVVFGPPAISTTLGLFLSYPPEGVAVDGAGNIYVAESGPVQVMPPGCASSSCLTTLGGGFSVSEAVAVDGAGNVYVADSGNNAVYEMPPYCGSSSCVTMLGGGFNQPYGVAVDGSGNVYVADQNNKAVKEMLPGCASSSCVTTLGGGFDYPEGVAVDGSGNVYVADTTHSAVKEMPPGCTSANYTASLCTITTLGGGFLYPAQVAVDGGGNVYVADTGNRVAKAIPPGCASSACVVTLGSGFDNPVGVAVDQSGNVYVADNLFGEVEELELATAPSFSFASTNVDSESSDSPQTVLVRNIGNSPLTFPVPASGDNPSVSANFTLDASTTCPEIPASSSAGMLAAGASCSLAIDFDPAASGPLTGSVVLTDNNLNVANATQSIGLSGTGNSTGATTATTTTVSCATCTPNPAYGTSLTFTAVVSPSTGSTTPTGSIAFSVDGGASVAGTAATCPGGSHADSLCATYSTSTLTAGTHTVEAIFSATGNFQGSSNSTGVTVAQAPTSITVEPTPSTLTYGQTLSSSTLTGGTAISTVTSATVSGTFTFTTPTTVPPAGSSSQSVTFTPGDNTDYASTIGSVTVQVNSASLTITWPTASAITYGQALSASTLSGGSALSGSTVVTGTFAFTTPSTVPLAGTQSESVTFTPSNTGEYSSMSSTVSVLVNKAPTSITVEPTPSTLTYGQTLSSSTLSSGTAISTVTSASVPGTFTFTTPTTVPPAGSSSQSVTFTPGDSADYLTTTGSVTVQVNAASLTITWPTASAITYGQALSASTLSGGSALSGSTVVTGTFAFTTPSTVPLAGTQSESVTFTPSNTGEYSSMSSTVSVLVNKAPTTVSVPPTASAITSGQTLASSTLSGGNAISTITSAAVSGTFTFTSPSTAPTATASQSVTFTPSDTGDYIGATTSVTVTVNTSSGPVATITPPSLSFGALYQGSIVTKTVTITNSGNAAMTIRDSLISLASGGDSSQFLIVNLCPKSLAAGKSCLMTVTFLAGPFYNPQTATLMINDNAPGSPQQVPLTATVIDPVAQFSPGSLSFGTVKTGSSSGPKSITVTSVGGTALSISKVSIAGADPGDYSETNTCASETLKPKATCSITVTFKPTARGARPATLQVTDTAQNSPQSISLSGTGD